MLFYIRFLVYIWRICALEKNVRHVVRHAFSKYLCRFPIFYAVFVFASACLIAYPQTSTSLESSNKIANSTENVTLLKSGLHTMKKLLFCNVYCVFSIYMEIHIYGVFIYGNDVD